jgi:hypothetical protein
VRGVPKSPRARPLQAAGARTRARKRRAGPPAHEAESGRVLATTQAKAAKVQRSESPAEEGALSSSLLPRRAWLLRSLITSDDRRAAATADDPPASHSSHAAFHASSGALAGCVFFCFIPRSSLLLPGVARRPASTWLVAVLCCCCCTHIAKQRCWRMPIPAISKPASAVIAMLACTQTSLARPRHSKAEARNGLLLPISL